MDIAVIARRVKWHTTQGIEEEEGTGGLLARTIDVKGPAAILALWRPGTERMELEDTGLHIKVQKSPIPAHVEMDVYWEQGPTHHHSLPLPPPQAITDITAALHDPHQAIFYAQGHWMTGIPDGLNAGIVPPIHPHNLGNAQFRKRFNVKMACTAGAMAGGIASVEMVEALAKEGILGFFGAGGLPLNDIENALQRLQQNLKGKVYGANLLHSPAEPAVEEATVDLYLKYNVPVVDASAYMQLTPAIVRYRLSGIHEKDGKVVVPNRLLAKVSRPEVADFFLRPPPEKMVESLVAQSILSPRQAQLARHIPMADGLTGEADSGGHTDRRPLTVMIPILRRLRDRLSIEHAYPERPFIGAAGGLGDPWSIAAALSLGADYIMTGSINQATLEAGTSQTVKEMLSAAGMADMTTGPAPDMFEIGASVQVLARGSMYAQRAGKLYELYRSYNALEDIPSSERERIEKQIFQRPLTDVWKEVQSFWQQRDPHQLKTAETDPHHRMALCFRWYLGLSSRWARTGDPQRKRDYQIWCGPAMGLFNDWVRGTWLEPLAARKIVTVHEALLRGTAIAQRIQIARMAGLPLPAGADQIPPSP